MMSPDILDRMAALEVVSPFDRLTARELAVVAQQVRPRAFAPGALLVEAGQVADLLHIVAAGWGMAGGARAPLLFDIPSLLFSLPVPCDYRAGPEGLETLTLVRPHLFTLARECPDFIVGLIDMEALPPCG